MRRVIVIALAVLTFAACGGDDDDNTAATDNADTDDTTTTSAGADDECVPVPQGLLDAIASSEEAGVGMMPVAGAGWKSPDFEDVTFIAMRFSATGIDDQVGVWAMNNFDSGGGLMFAAEGIAQDFSALPDANTYRKLRSRSPTLGSKRRRSASDNPRTAHRVPLSHRFAMIRS